MCLVFFIVLPVIAIMAGDMHYATERAIAETQKMERLRDEIKSLMKGE